MYFFEDHGLEEKQTLKHLQLNSSNFPMHFHRAFEFIHVLDGVMNVIIEEKNYTLQSKEAVLVFPNQLHQLTTPETSKSEVLIFSPEMIGHFYSNYKNKEPENNKLAVVSNISPENLESVYAQKSLLYSYCNDLINATSFKEVTISSKRKVVQNILLYVDRHFNEDCSLKTVAQNLQYDYAYLSKTFYQYTKLTFTEYLNRYRVAQAAEHLKQTDLSVKEIALLCGFANLRTFNRNFKRYTLLSPTDFRRVS
ncbi:helix-turn-helix domain-containing protein [Alkalibacterium sp.]